MYHKLTFSSISSCFCRLITLMLDGLGSCVWPSRSGEDPLSPTKTKENDYFKKQRNNTRQCSQDGKDKQRYNMTYNLKYWNPPPFWRPPFVPPHRKMAIKFSGWKRTVFPVLGGTVRWHLALAKVLLSYLGNGHAFLSVSMATSVRSYSCWMKDMTFRT